MDKFRLSTVGSRHDARSRLDERLKLAGKVLAPGPLMIGIGQVEIVGQRVLEREA